MKDFTVKIMTCADELLEEAAKKDLSLEETLNFFLPEISKKIDAVSAAVYTLDEEGEYKLSKWKKSDDYPPGGYPAELTVIKDRKDIIEKEDFRWLIEPLDVAGIQVGMLGFCFRISQDKLSLRRELLHVICEELDGILWHILEARKKQQLIEKLNKVLGQKVFRKGLFEAVKYFHREIDFDKLIIFFKDQTGYARERLQYCIFKGPDCIYDSNEKKYAALEKLLRETDKNDIVKTEEIKEKLSLNSVIEQVMEVGITANEKIGKLIISSKKEMGSFGRDMLRVFAEVITQRLVDYNRERRYLAQFFSYSVIDKLVKDPAYIREYLSPTTEKVAILYADINSFTQLCEMGLNSPQKIADFVNKWSDGVVRLIWEHGGVFDKMVGDCVIALFGPPFYKTDIASRAKAAVKTALDIQEFTRNFQETPSMKNICKNAGVEGMGVAVGINLCEVSIGQFGPNRDFTAFGSGMNKTARLQGKASFREIFAMDNIYECLENQKNISFHFEGPFSINVKNVRDPLKYYKVVNKKAEG
ncbi:MAG: adenylate/guanylate cyclase domain-containing protein [Elusimicrobiota bacterium]